MDLQYSVYYWNLSSFYPEDDNLSDSDRILHSVGLEESAAAILRWSNGLREPFGFDGVDNESMTFSDLRLSRPQKRLRSRPPLVHWKIQCCRAQHFCSASEPDLVAKPPDSSRTEYFWSASTVAYGTVFAGRYIR
ncbi:hypothetical protein EYF80_034587 [Liparis tanakae]|uniref:Uncharacterized protein n=1 Tax=Liparis tanakae TaxID=230148 RepID=A0A4Z2GRE7_9TELE|nr:hypothetical protein EYF80_034587 [Liparis tanakae]